MTLAEAPAGIRLAAIFAQIQSRLGQLVAIRIDTLHEVMLKVDLRAHSPIIGSLANPEGLEEAIAGLEFNQVLLWDKGSHGEEYGVVHPSVSDFVIAIAKTEKIEVMDAEQQQLDKIATAFLEATRFPS